MRAGMSRKTISSAKFLLLCLSSIPCSAQPRYDPVSSETYRVDSIGRVLEVSSRADAPCPPQTSKTAVLLIAGQSNTANSGETRFHSKYPNRAVNYFDGKCYPAESPLL